MTRRHVDVTIGAFHSNADLVDVTREHVYAQIQCVTELKRSVPAGKQYVAGCRGKQRLRRGYCSHRIP